MTEQVVRSSRPSPLPREDSVLIRGGLVADVERRTLEEMDVLTKGGYIERVGPSLEVPRSEVRIVDARRSVVLPGLVNAHTHSYGTLCRQVKPWLPLEPWMMYAWAFTTSRSREAIYVSAMLQAVEAIRTGTTTLLDQLGGDVSSNEAAMTAYEDSGLRTSLAPMISDLPLPDTVAIPAADWRTDTLREHVALRPPPFDVAIDATLDLRAKWLSRSDRVSVILGPSAPQRCSPAMLERCAEVSADMNIPMHMHLLETRAQALMPPYGGHESWIDYLSSIEMLSERLSLAHAIWISPDEIAKLARADVTLVHNPHSNLQIGSGIADLGSWREAGVHIGLGTDGSNCGGSLDMLESIRLAAILHRPACADPKGWESSWSALALSISGGAGALGLESGALRPGARADVSVFGLVGTAFASGEDPIDSLVLSSYKHEAQTTVVDGVVVFDRGVVETTDEAALLDEAADMHKHLVRSNDRYAAIARAQESLLTAHSAQAPPTRDVMKFHAAFKGP